MAQIITPGGRIVEVLTVAPAAQASTASEVVVTGSGMDARVWQALSYTIVNATQTITYNVYGANLSTYADEVLVSGPTDVLAAGISSYSVVPPPFGYYRVKIIDKVGGVHGTVTVNGLAK